MDFQSIAIAGATGGIGKALVAEAVLRWPQARILCLGRNAEKLLNLRESFGPSAKIQILQIDAKDYFDKRAFHESLKSMVGSIDLAIFAIGTLNASENRPEKSLGEIREEDMVETFRVNVASAVAFAAALKPLMRHERPSRFIALSAKAGSIGDNRMGGWYSYRMSKAALNMSIRNIAIEFRRSGCHSLVAAVHPGTTLTAFSEAYVSQWPEGKVAGPTETSKRLLDLCENLEEKHNGAFLHWDGSELPW